METGTGNMKLAYSIVAIIATSSLITTSIVLIEAYYGHFKDPGARWRCAVVWFLTLIVGHLYVMFFIETGRIPYEWMYFTLAIWMTPVSIMAIRGYGAVTLGEFVRRCLAIAVVSAAAATSVTLVRPVAGEWAWALPVAAALAAFYGWLHRTNPPGDAAVFFITAIGMLAVLLVLLTAMVMLVERCCFEL